MPFQYTAKEKRRYKQYTGGKGQFCFDPLSFSGAINFIFFFFDVTIIFKCKLYFIANKATKNSGNKNFPGVKNANKFVCFQGESNPHYCKPGGI
jgi:hypothetical protein